MGRLRNPVFKCCAQISYGERVRFIVCSTFVITLSVLHCPNIFAFESIVLRANADFPDEASEYLSRIAEPSILTIDSNQAPSDIVSRICGRVTTSYLDRLRKANPTLPPLSEPVASPTVVTFPACTYVEGETVVRVREGDSYSRIALDRIGLDGQRTIGKIEDANSAKKKAIQPGDTLTLPYSTQEVRYKLIEGVSAATAVRDLQKLAEIPGKPNARALIKADDNPSNEQLIRPDGSSISEHGDCFPGDRESWPFNVDRLWKIIEHNAQQLRNRGLDVGAAQVATIDSGVDGFGSSWLPRRSFAINGSEEFGDPQEDNDGNSYVHDVWGVNVYDKGEPVAFDTYEDADHGTHVAGLLLGGPKFHRRYLTHTEQNVPARIRLKAISLLLRKVSASENGPLVKFSSPPGGIDLAVSYAVETLSSVINISYASIARPTTVFQSLSNNPHTLLIAAAGNNKSDFDRDALVYPAGFGGSMGDLSSQVITVAAHNGNGKLWRNSNYGASRVDVAAPGCAIDSYGLRGELSAYSGTSFAAPIVGFTAALLMSQGVSKPRLVKSRILASVDIAPYWRNVVAAEGTLNIYKALNIFLDSIEKTNSRGAFISGRIKNSSTIKVCGIPIRRASKISPNYVREDGVHVMRVMYSDQERKQRVVYCGVPQGKIDIFDEESGDTESVEWGELVDVIPRLLMSSS